MMIPDPTEEIKSTRHRLGAELGFDLHKIIEDTRKRQSDSGREYVRLPSRKPQITKHCIEVAGQPLPDGGSTSATR
jgi:hypothetical protein